MGDKGAVLEGHGFLSALEQEHGHFLPLEGQVELTGVVTGHQNYPKRSPPARLQCEFGLDRPQLRFSAWLCVDNTGRF